ncbi:transcriptional regulator [Thermosipho melanesiensis]|uniref:Two component transcriptional regulator, winged helix family n=2 Tax=Thermosipho melanesiensis TaxID=46541 RepID=A6LP08_THEM4|nr:response regulator transcription factor [Thermosipho melanesiensis]ABR31659.1 two component transcriptional regulator, winged helix family [Thermosipho melanesiensis BI429]APT74686.1 transcriptional regulator [Thermosipho melanesiensis]OOC35183.1 transcriptional regulator [Thermosipho melanesiensis]OOC35393.1 transcriptional regulator [Thermosipho melanesiensis]OOC36644.1 transcriptional regulator [Thermosipho melanesiensis]
MKRILIVEDDETLRDLLKRYIKSEGYEVDEAENNFEMRKKLSKERYDLVLLDIMLPDGLSTDELPEIKVLYPKLGIIIVSAKDNDSDKIYGLEIGADDYVTKPFNPREVVARIKAFFRRISGEREVIKFGQLQIFCDDYLVKLNDKIIDFTAKEFEILCLLAKNPNVVFSRERILDIVWKDEFISDRVVDVHISNIRNKLGKDSIITVRGVGYKFNARKYNE